MTFQHDRVVYPSHYFQYGTLIWLTGQNAGISRSTFATRWAS